MQICLVREAPATGGTKPSKPSRGTLLRTRNLTIGSAANQQLQLVADGVDPRHAVLAPGLGGRLRLTSLSSKGVRINGRRALKAVLFPGDTLQVGAASVTYDKERPQGLIVLRIHEPSEEDDGPSCAVRGLLDRDAPGPNMSLWSWTLTITVAVLFLLIPLSGVVMPAARKPVRETRLVPSDNLWSPGPLHAAHQFIGNDCNACHKTPFTQVRNDECASCHADVQHHVDVRTPDVNLFAEERCEPCHREHKQPSVLTMRDTRLCTDCHANLQTLKPQTRVQNVMDFGSEHPEFRLTVLTDVVNGAWHSKRLDRRDPQTFIERSHLRFSHAQHLDPKGIKSPTGERVLTCQNCHRPSSSGREMLPVKMETHCSECHSLRFDEHDPSSGVPHGDLQALSRTLQDHFSREYLQTGPASARLFGAGGLRRPGEYPGSMSAEEQMRAREWVDAQSLKIARELLEKRVCADCHEVTRVAGKTGFDQWRVEPVHLTEHWMPLARFSHAAHISQPCTSCHEGADKSKRATDILMPKIEKCRECHGGAADTTKVPSDCVMCHQFHMPNRGRLFVTKTAADPKRKNPT
jgi:predicted CXXCH cytochrome family protein